MLALARPAVLALLLAPSALAGGPVAVPFRDVVLRDLEPPHAERAWSDVLGAAEAGGVDALTLWPRVALEGAPEAYLVDPGEPGDHVTWSSPVNLLGRVRAGRIVCAEAPEGTLAGWVTLPTSSTAPLRLRLEVPADAVVPATELDLARARAGHYARLVSRELPGAAWFRHRYEESAADARELAAAAGEEPRVPQPASRTASRFRPDDFETFGLLSGGRALAENLQLERMLPDPGSADGETVPVGDLRGVDVLAFDWGPLLAGAEPATDPLAARVPADQYALFCPSLAAFADLVDELQRDGEPVVAAFEARSRDARTRQRYEEQLGVPLDGLARSLGGLVAGSVAVTGSDPQLRTGSDLAVVIEARQPEALAAFLAARQELGREGHPDARTVQLDVGAWRVRGVATPDRRLSSYLVVDDGFAVLSNSLAQVRALEAVASGRSAPLSTSDEYRFFRARYPVGAPGEAGFLLLPDAAIRTWCGPRWRIAASRRTRALAALSDLTARHARELLSGEVEPRAVAADYAIDLGEVRLDAHGVHSSTYGDLNFLTPTSELGLDLVTRQEADLYERWRDGYERNWSNFFDPIGASLVLAEGRLGLDLSVVPLIAGSEYRELFELVGDERLEGRDGDPHDDAVIHFVGALDRESEPIREMGSFFSTFSEELGLNGLSWLGDWYSIHVDDGPLLDELLGAEDLEAAWEILEVDLDSLPLVLEVGVSSPLRLAAFLTSIRTLAESSAPGLVSWHTEKTDDGRAFVRVSSPLPGEELSLYYATTRDALIVGFERRSLVAALDRWSPPAAAEGTDGGPADAGPSDGEPTSFLGETVALELEPRALLYLGLFDGGDPRELAREASYRNLPVLEEWRSLLASAGVPDRDPVEVHAALFGERLLCPGGEGYAPDPTTGALASRTYGLPAAPQRGPGLPPVLRSVERIRLGLTHEPRVDGLRARGELLRER